MKLNIVTAGTGIQWVKLGIQTFFRQPLALSGLFFMYMALASVVSMIPFIGVALALALVPGFTLGLMAATQEATRGKFPMPSILISAFRAGQQRLRAMLLLGAIYAVACLIASLLSEQIAPMPKVVPEAGLDLPQAVALQKAMAATLLFYFPISLLFWHAPALVHWHGIAPVKSLFFSLVACLKNFKAFLLYGLAWGGVFIFGAIVITTFARFIGSPQVVGAAMVPGALLMAAMFFTSIYFTFRDSFVTDPEPTQDPTTGETP